MSTLRILPMGDAALLVEASGPEEAAALHDLLSAPAGTDPAHPSAVREVIAGARTVLVRYAPEEASAAALAAWIRSLTPESGTRQEGPLVRIPVVYDGADLAEVARLTGLSAAEVVRRHTGSDYRVAFTGFAPGFAYLTGGDPALDVPRRRTPRDRVPAGAVGLAGPYSGVYPRTSPGGWQLIGTTTAPIWDERSTPPALLAPGMRVRFEAVDRPENPAHPAAGSVEASPGEGTPGLRVLQTGALLTVQDLGRPGLGRYGVSPSGAMDPESLGLANAAVGNPPGTPALEACGGPVEVEACGPQTLAVVGATPDISVRRRDGRLIGWAEGRPIPLADGDRVSIGALRESKFTYVAVRGGAAVPTVLGSAATDTLSRLGPRPLSVGDVVPVGRVRRLWPVRDEHLALRPPPGPGPIPIDTVPGPREDWFTPAGREAFWTRTWTISPRADRVGIRLDGEDAVDWTTNRELPSEGMVAGAVEVPADGRPLVLMADHPVTGGYPVIACVTRRHLSRLAQAPAGATIRFRRCPIPVVDTADTADPTGPGERNPA